jgi:hypothetical protein
MELSHDRAHQPYGLLYPIMLIAAIAVIVFSILGIVSIAGWMPNALSSATAAQPRAESPAVPVSARSGAAFECAECGMINGIREIERSGVLIDARVEVKPTALLP